MKLVEIKDIREGQIYERSRCIFVVMRRSGIDSVVLRLYCHNRKPEPNNAYEAEAMHEVRIDALNDCQLIGKLGITHSIEGKKLIEIPPVFKGQKINIDDIVKVIKDGSFPWVVDTTYNAGKYTRYISLLSYHDNDFSEDEVEKIGILGVTHEFVNNREEK